MPRPSNKRRALLPAALGLLLMAALFVVATSHLFVQRFQRGDLFPAYSSLRSDPLGVKVLAEGLAATGREVKRNYTPLANLELSTNTTLVQVGLKARFLGKQKQDRLLSFVEQGGQLLMAYGPRPPGQSRAEECECPAEDEDKAEDSTEEQQTDEPSLSTKPASAAETTETDEEKTTGLLKRLGLELAVAEFEEADRPKGRYRTLAQGQLASSALQLPWFSARYFTGLAEEWQVILQSGPEQPVLIARPWGEGRIILASDAYFLSNEAMWQHRQPRLLAWALGRTTTIVFDETVHGLSRQRSLSGLLKDFQLQGVVAGLLLVAVLFVWRSSQPLLPPRPSLPHQGKQGQGRDQFSGLVNIIRRHPPTDLLATCLAHWQKGQGHWCQKHPEQLQEMKKLASHTNKKDMPIAYQRIRTLIHAPATKQDPERQSPNVE